MHKTRCHDVISLWSTAERMFPQGFLRDGKDVLVGSATAGLASVLHSLLPSRSSFCIFSLWFELRLWVHLFTGTFGAAGERTEQAKVYVAKERLRMKITEMFSMNFTEPLVKAL